MRRLTKLPENVAEILTINSSFVNSSDVYMFYRTNDGKIINPDGTAAEENGKMLLKAMYAARTQAKLDMATLRNYLARSEALREESLALGAGEEKADTKEIIAQVNQAVDEADGMILKKVEQLDTKLQAMENSISDLEELFPTKQASEALKSVMQSIQKSQKKD